MSRRLPGVILRAIALIALVSPVSVAPAAAAPDASTAAVELAQRLLAPDTSDSDAAEVVSQAFAWAGMATEHADGSLRAGIAPTLPLHVTEQEAAMLGNDARARVSGSSRLTLGQLANALRDMCWSVPDGTDPGRVLAQVLAQAIRDARQTTQSPHSFVPLFIAAYEKKLAPDLDLAAGTAPSDNVHLSLLEAELILSMHLRGDSSYPEPQPAAFVSGPDRSGAADDQVAAAAPESMCSDELKQLGDFETPARLGLGVAGGKLSPMDTIYDKLQFTKVEKVAAGRVLDIAKVVAQLNNITFTLDAAPEEVHHSHGDELNTVQFIALAKAPLPTQDPRLLALYDCLNALGYPAPDDPRSQYSSWKVSWDLSGLAGHAQLSLAENAFDLPGHQVAHLDGAGADSVIVDMLSEPEDVHQTGVERNGTFSMSAHLETDQVPLNALVDAASIDLPVAISNALIDVASNFYQLIGGPTVTKNVAVTWHEPRQDAGTITFDVASDDDQPLTAQKFLPTFGRTSLFTGLHTTIHRHEVAHLSVDGKGQLDANFEYHQTQLIQDRGRQSCRALDKEHDWSVDTTVQVDEHGSLSQVPINWQVDVLPDGTYRLAYSGAPIPTKITHTTQRVGSGTCDPNTNGSTGNTTTSESNRERSAVQVSGTVDPDRPRVFRGAETQVRSDQPGSPTTTITWDVAPQ